MRATVRLGAIALALAITATGCGAPPTADIDAARAAVDKAVTDGAGQYAAESLKAAQEPGLPSTPNWPSRKPSGSSRTTRPRNSPPLQRRPATRPRPMPSRPRSRLTRSPPRRTPTPRPGRRPRRRRSASGARSGRHQDQGRQAGVPGRGEVGARCRGWSSSKRRLEPTGRSSTQRSCARSRCSIRPPLTPCGSGNSRRRS